ATDPTGGSPPAPIGMATAEPPIGISVSMNGAGESSSVPGGWLRLLNEPRRNCGDTSWGAGSKVKASSVTSWLVIFAIRAASSTPAPAAERLSSHSSSPVVPLNQTESSTTRNQRYFDASRLQ